MQIIYFYFIISLFIFLTPKVRIKNQTLTNEFYITNSFLIIFFVALFFGLRNIHIGIDTPAYLEMFRTGSFSRKKGEPLFSLLIKVLHILLHEDKAFLFTMSLLIALLDLLFYQAVSKYECFKIFIILSCFYYFYQFHLNLYRNALSIGIIDLSYVYWVRKKKRKFFLLGIIGTLIHYSGIVFLLFPFLDYFSLKIQKKRLHTFLFGLLLVFFSTSVMELFVSIIPDFCQPIHVFKHYFLKAPLYLKPRFHITHSHFISLLIILIFNINFNKLRKSSYFRYYIFHSVFFVFIALFKNSVALYDRLYLYIQLFEPILIFEFHNLFREKRISQILILLICLLYSIFTIFIWGPRNLIFPYTF